MNARFWVGIATAALMAACGGPTTDGDTTTTGPDGTCAGKCDANVDLISELEGRNDPIATWLRGRADAQEEGRLQAGYAEILFEINAQLGCEEKDAKTFIVSDALIEDEPFPRPVSVACASKTSDRFKLFMSLPNGDGEGDLDDQSIEMFAWDPDASIYRFYKTEADPSGKLIVEVEPAECAGCHLGPAELMSVDGTGVEMMPVMNELVEPWPHWNAEPLFRSQDFSLPEGMDEQPVYAELTGGGKLGSASELEQIIRDGQRRVVSARYKKRRDDATIAGAMGYLRPLFCEEQINYVSERGDSGLLPMGAVLDDNIRNLYTKINATDWAYPWFYNQTRAVRFEISETLDTRLMMLPTRGAIDQELEVRLTRVLTPEQMLQIRFLDWKQPVLSSFRCDLWVAARERMRQEAPTLEGESHADVIPQLYAEIMQINGTPLTSPVEGEFIILDRASEEAVATLEQMLSAGEVTAAGCDRDDPLSECTCGEDSGVCVGSLEDFGQIAQTHLNEIEASGRDAIREQAQQTTCEVAERFENRPFIESYESECAQGARF